MPPDVHDFMLQRWDEVRKGKGKPYEVDIISKDSRRISLLVSHRDMELSGERKYCAVIKDITEYKTAEQDLIKHRKHLEGLVKELENKNKELERFNNLFIRREFRIKELKDKIKKLEK